MRGITSLSAVAVLSVLASLAAACDNPHAPSPPTSSASLAIEDPYVTLGADLFGDGQFELEVRFLLREIKGTSSATLQSLSLTVPSGQSGTATERCLSPLRVPAGDI